MLPIVPGTKIKTYTLEKQIGRGASGEVWKASDDTRAVAIKFMNESLMRSSTAAKHRERLEREIEALSRLKHPNIPTLYDHDLDFDRPYLVMDFIEGETYDKLIASGEMLALPLAKRLDNLKQLADALETAHELGIIHRDIKPANMSGIEKPYLLDFSVSLKNEDVMSTMREIGTALYMSPDDPPDALGDNFSFALVSYEMLFGTHAIFNAEDMIPQMRVYTRFLAGERLRNREWRLPSRVPLEELPLDLRDANLARLDEIYEKALGERETRYVNVLHFVDDVRAAIPSASAAPANNGVQFEATMMEFPRFRPEDAQPLADAVPASPSPAKPPEPAPAPAAPPPKPVIKAAMPSEDQFTILEVQKAEEAQKSEPASPAAPASPTSSLPLVPILLGVVIVVLVIILFVLTRGG
jgi:serine/threonine protein kinase